MISIQPGESLFKAYVLPLVGFNKESFGDIFIECFTNKEGTNIWVEVIEPGNVLKFRNKWFQQLTSINDRHYYVYQIPSMFVEDVRLINAGKYSKISHKAKTLIRTNSGLSVGKSTSMSILALDRHPALINHLATKLGLSYEEGITYLNDNELLSKPKPEHFIEFYLTEESV